MHKPVCSTMMKLWVDGWYGVGVGVVVDHLNYGCVVEMIYGVVKMAAVLMVVLV